MIAIVVIASIIVTAAGFEVPTIATDGTSVTVTASDLILENGDANADSPISISMNELQSQTDANVDAITGINELLANASSSTQVVAEEVAAVAAAVNTVSQAAAGAATACAELATSHAEDMATLRAENLLLRNGLAALTAELAKVEAASKSLANIPRCDPLTDPDHGAVHVIGKHGSKVPVSVHATFICDAGYAPDFADGAKSPTGTTCTLGEPDENGDSAAVALWSPYTDHPGCVSCPKNCADCLDKETLESDTCVRCYAGHGSKRDGDGKITACLKDYGRTKATPGKSCKDIYETDKEAESGLYWINIPKAASNHVRKVYCAMQNVEGGGGWTLVTRGVGNNAGCYKEVSMGRDRECNAPSGAADSRATFIYSDDFINGLGGKVFWLRGTGITRTDMYADATKCTYTTAKAAAEDMEACRCLHAEPELQNCRQGQYSWQFFGLSSWIPAGGMGCLHTSIHGEREIAWQLRGGALDRGCGSSYCGSDQTGCDMELYVR